MLTEVKLISVARAKFMYPFIVDLKKELKNIILWSLLINLDVLEDKDN